MMAILFLVALFLTVIVLTGLFIVFVNWFNFSSEVDFALDELVKGKEKNE